MWQPKDFLSIKVRIDREFIKPDPFKPNFSNRKFHCQYIDVHDCSYGHGVFRSVKILDKIEKADQVDFTILAIQSPKNWKEYDITMKISTEDREFLWYFRLIYLNQSPDLNALNDVCQQIEGIRNADIKVLSENMTFVLVYAQAYGNRLLLSKTLQEQLVTRKNRRIFNPNLKSIISYNKVENTNSIEIGSDSKYILKCSEAVMNPIKKKAGFLALSEHKPRHYHYDIKIIETGTNNTFSFKLWNPIPYMMALISSNSNLFESEEIDYILLSDDGTKIPIKTRIVYFNGPTGRIITNNNLISVISRINYKLIGIFYDNKYISIDYVRNGSYWRDDYCFY